MTNKEKIEKIRNIYSKFLDSLNLFKKEANRRSEIKLKAREQNEIDQLLEQINKNY